MWLLKLVAGAAVLLLVLSKIFVFNTTESLPVGLYFKTNLAPAKGDIVLLCPPVNDIVQAGLERKFISPGLCPGGYGYLIKILAAEAGDQVQISKAGVTINNQFWPNSARQDLEFLEPNADINKQLIAKEIIVMTKHEQSFDSRYFGIILEANLISPLIPLWTKE